MTANELRDNFDWYGAKSAESDSFLDYEQKFPPLKDR
jgi:hypothetical protein